MRMRRRLLVLPAALVVVVGLAPAAAAAGNGDVWAWGYDGNGQLGTTTAPASGAPGALAPVRVQLPAGVALRSVAAGGSAVVAIDRDGQAYAWGDNSVGELGMGTTGQPPQSATPVRVHQPRGTHFVAVSEGADYAIAVDRAGALWGWGDVPGSGVANQPRRIPLPAGTRLTGVAAGTNYAFALDRSGGVWAWGNNDAGNLGTGNTTAQPVPAAVLLPAGVHVTQIAAGGIGGPFGGNRGIALDSTGAVWSWGDNGAGELGDGTNVNRPTPVRALLPAGVRIRAISAGGDFTATLDTTGAIWDWGSGDALATGDAFNAGAIGGGAGSTSTPVRAHLPASTTFVSLATAQRSVVALDRHGQAWASGDGDVGQLGNRSTTPAAFELVRVAMPAGVRWTALAGGSSGRTFFGYVAASAAASSGVSLSSIATSLMSPGQAIRPVGSFAISGALAALAVVFLTFPADLFNHTLTDNYDAIESWWNRRFRRREHRSTAETWRAFVLVVAVGAALQGLLDPSFGHGWSTATTYAALLLAALFGIGIRAGVTAGFHRARHGSAPAYPIALPLGLVAAGLCVAVSRLAHFEPGYLYGVVAAVAVRRKLAVAEDGQLVAISSLAALGLAIGAWFAIVPLSHHESTAGLSAGIVLVHNVLASLFTGGLVTCVLGLVPLTFLPGAKLRAWNPKVWLATFAVCLLGLFQVLLRPHTGHESKTPTVTSLVLFAVFGVGSVAVRHVSGRRRSRASGTEPPSLRTTLAELVPRQRREDQVDPVSSTTSAPR